MKKLNRKWLQNGNYHLEDGIFDLSADTKHLLEKTQISAEKRRKFKGECKKLVLELLLKMSKKSLKYALARTASFLAPINIIQQPEQSAIFFRAFADQLCSLKKISSSVAEMLKNHYEEFLKMAKYEDKEEFLKFSYKEDQLDVFLDSYLLEIVQGSVVYL